MLDLKKLEESLDAALEQETPESLSTWLRNKRKDALTSRLGKGFVEKRRSIQFVTKRKKSSPCFQKSNNQVPNNNYQNAA